MTNTGKFTLIGFVSIILVGFLQTGPLKAAPGVQWESDFKTAVQIAKESNRLVLLHFYGDRCPPCKIMDRDVFSSNQVADSLSTDFVPLKINWDENQRAAQNLNIIAVPADLIITPDGGEIIYRRRGGASALQYTSELLSVVKQYRQHIQSKQPVPANPVVNRPEVSSVPSPATLSGKPLEPPQVENIPEIQAQPTDIVPESMPEPQVAETSSEDALFSLDSAPSGPEQVEVNETEYGLPEFESDPLLEQTILQPAEPATLASANEPIGNSDDETNEFAAAADFSLVDKSSELDVNVPKSEPDDSILGLAIPSAPQSPPNTNEMVESTSFILEGYCPVVLQDEERWARGQKEFAFHFKNQFFMFSSKEAMQKFAKNPERYTPVAMGEDVVEMAQEGKRIKGKRTFGAWYHGRIYLFSTQTNYDAFADRPGYFSDMALKLESALGATAVAAPTDKRINR